MYDVIDYQCLTCHGYGVEPFWEALAEGISRRGLVETDTYPYFSLPNDYKDIQNTLSQMLMTLVEKNNIDPLNSAFILASTKGEIESYIWQQPNERFQYDPYAHLLNRIFKENSLRWQRWCVVSNACASSHGAIAQAQSWLKNYSIEKVVIVSFDCIGKFIQKGFAGLRALSPSHQARPFSKDRDGFLLGEAIAGLVIGKKQKGISLSGVSTQVDGHAVTKPNLSGDSIYKALTCLDTNPLDIDVVVAHGTSTAYNDITEDNAYKKYFQSHRPYIVSTKWAVGHTLAVSGMLDVIFAIEMLKKNVVLGVKNQTAVDPSFSGHFLKENKQVGSLSKVLVSSLGFGGINSVVCVG